MGFAAETENVVEHAREKAVRKGADLIVANDVSAADAGFEVDTNRVILVDSSGPLEEIPLMSKRAVADRLCDVLAARIDAAAGAVHRTTDRTTDRTTR